MMDKHVDLLGIFYIIWGALSVLTGLAMLTLGMGAAAIITTTTARPDRGEEIAAGLAAVVLASLAVLVLVWGALHIANGIALRRFRPWARTLGLVFAVLNLFLLPFGTALGIYGLWVLVNDQTRRLFEAPPVS
jgi:hypothetical protein